MTECLKRAFRLDTRIQPVFSLETTIRVWKWNLKFGEVVKSYLPYLL